MATTPPLSTPHQILDVLELRTSREGRLAYLTAVLSSEYERGYSAALEKAIEIVEKTE
jgi:hypothetical protein